MDSNQLGGHQMIKSPWPTVSKSVYIAIILSGIRKILWSVNAALTVIDGKLYVWGNSIQISANTKIGEIFARRLINEFQIALKHDAISG